LLNKCVHLVDKYSDTFNIVLNKLETLYLKQMFPKLNKISS